MRATLLQYRSPKEQTAEILYPLVWLKQVTHNGKKLGFKRPHTAVKQRLEKSSEFSREMRFRQYKQCENNIGTLVGPGTYNEHFSFQKLDQNPCKVKILKPEGITKKNSDAYIMLGNHMMYQSIFLAKESKNELASFKVLRSPVDLNASIPDLSISDKTFFAKTLNRSKYNQRTDKYDNNLFQDSLILTKSGKFLKLANLEQNKINHLHSKYKDFHIIHRGFKGLNNTINCINQLISKKNSKVKIYGSSTTESYSINRQNLKANSISTSNKSMTSYNRTSFKPVKMIKKFNKGKAFFPIFADNINLIVSK